MKELYELIDMEIVWFDTEDVIATSDPENDGGNGEEEEEYVEE